MYDIKLQVELKLDMRWCDVMVVMYGWLVDEGFFSYVWCVFLYVALGRLHR